MKPLPRPLCPLTVRSLMLVATVVLAGGFTRGVEAQSPTDLRFVDFVSDQNGWLVGDGLLRTRDGGTTWDWVTRRRITRMMDFANDSVGWAIDGAISEWDGVWMIDEGTIVKTQNGGKTWYEQFTFPEPMQVRSLRALSSDVAYAVGIRTGTYGASGWVLKTSDGNSWNEVFTTSWADLNSVWFLDENNGVAAGDGLWVRTSDGGSSWDHFYVNSLVSALQLTDLSTGFYLFDRELYSWTLSGASVRQDRVSSFFALDQQSVVAVRAGDILKTYDGGLNWERKFHGFANQKTDLELVTFVGNEIGWAVGWAGTIMKTVDGGDTWTDESIDLTTVSIDGAPAETPEKFSLSQNYPNPFKPTSTISYSLPRAADVRLTVYDVLGREVAVLASGTKSAGTHDVSFDATGLPSGIFLYRVQVGDYVETKRMVVR